MTIGTAIVVSVGIIAAAWVATIAIGAWITMKKQKDAKNLTDAISAKIIANRDKK